MKLSENNFCLSKYIFPFNVSIEFKTFIYLVRAILKAFSFNCKAVVRCLYFLTQIQKQKYYSPNEKGLQHTLNSNIL